MKAKQSVRLRHWLSGLLVLGLTTTLKVGLAQISPPITILHSFNGSDGQLSESQVPWSGYDVFGAGLIQGKDGALYGTTLAGGANNNGTVFKLTTGGVFTSLYSFAGASDGDAPTGVIQGRDGALYGTTLDGGPYPFNGGLGTVFKITPSGVLTILHNFSDFGGGEWPYAGLIQGKDGALYGTTAFGGYDPPFGTGDGLGTVFKIHPDGSGFVLLYSFTGATDGANPWAALIQGKDGALYGTSSGFVGNQFGGEYVASVFKITPSGALTGLTNFNGDEFPYAGLIQGKDGALYGAAQTGGANNTGTVFKITPSGVLATLFSFSAISSAGVNADGANPSAALIQGKDGALYGTAANGGANGTGTVFRITTTGVFFTLYSFSALDSNGSNADGASPQAGLTRGKDGDFYGLASLGGPNNDSFGTGYGTAFKLTMTPVITHFSPTKGPVGASVTLTGANFTEASNVQFGNVYVGFKVNSDSSLTLTVPPGVKSARITIYNPFGKSVSSTQFKVTP